jgi:hypothetical protein
MKGTDTIWFNPNPREKKNFNDPEGKLAKPTYLKKKLYLSLREKRILQRGKLINPGNLKSRLVQ